MAVGNGNFPRRLRELLERLARRVGDQKGQADTIAGLDPDGFKRDSDFDNRSGREAWTVGSVFPEPDFATNRAVDQEADLELAGCEPSSKVATPPIRSAMKPEPTRLMMPKPSIIDSISAPRATP